MAQLVNIGGDHKDTSYRYKMPKLVAKVEGRGNGIKTVIVNMTEIAESLKVDPEYATKFFGMECCALSKYTASTERAVVNGEHSAASLATILEKFIDIFVLCPVCKLPETTMKVRKEHIKLDCAACGFNGPLNTLHKLATFISKNPPKKKKHSGTVAASTTTKPVVPKKSSKGESKSSRDATTSQSASVESEDQFFSETTAQEASEAQKELNEMKKAAKAAEEKASQLQRGDCPVAFLKALLDRKPSVDEITGELRRLHIARGLDTTQQVKSLLEAVLNIETPKLVVENLVKHAALLRKFAANKQAASLFIGCLEDLCGVTEPKLVARFPHILKALYDQDVLDEDSILQWYQAPLEASWLIKPSVAKSLKAKAKPFVDWLQNAEEDEE